MGTLARNELKQEFQRPQQNFIGLYKISEKLLSHSKDCYVGVIFTNAAVHQVLEMRKTFGF